MDAETPQGLARRRRHAAAQRRHAARSREGKAMFWVEVDSDVIETLVTLKWLTEGAETKRDQVGAAITEVLRELTEWLRNNPQLLDLLRSKS